MQWVLEGQPQSPCSYQTPLLFFSFYLFFLIFKKINVFFLFLFSLTSLQIYNTHIVQFTCVSVQVNRFNVVTELYNDHHYLIPEHFHHPPKEASYPLNQLSSLHSTPRQTLIYFSLYIVASSGHFI